MKNFFVILLALFCTTALFAQEFVAYEPPKPKPIDEGMPLSPLVVNGSQTPEINLGKVLKLSHRIFPVVIQNPSDEEIKYTGVVVNCSCTSILNKKDVPIPGVIPPHGELKLNMLLNANEMDSEIFSRMIRFELENYRQFQINFTGKLDTSIYMYYDDDQNQIKRGEINVGYIADPDAPWKTILHIVSEESNKDPLVLDKVACSKNFIAGLHSINDHHWAVELHGVNPMALGEFRDEGVMITMENKEVPENQKQVIFLPIIGICGTYLLPSADEVYMKPDFKGETYTKDIRIARQPFMDKNTLKAMIQGRPNPYVPEIYVLTVDELKVPKDIPGVEFTLEQEKLGVLVHCKMTMKDLVVGGVKAIFEAKGCKPAEVWFGILSETDRQRMLEEAKFNQEEAEKETEANQEQEEMQKDGGHW